MASRKTVRSNLRKNTVRDVRGEMYALLTEMQLGSLKIAKESLTNNNNAYSQYYVELASTIEMLRAQMQRHDRE